MAGCTYAGPEKQCGAPAQSESRYCFFHDPAKAKKRQDAARRGGQANKVPLPSVVTGILGAQPTCWEDVRGGLIAIVNALLAGEATITQAKVVSGWATTRLQVVNRGPGRQSTGTLPSADDADRQAWDTYYRDLDRQYGPNIVRVARSPESRAKVLSCLQYLRKASSPALERILAANEVKAKELEERERQRAMDEVV